jgi:CHAD domain-containing protein
MVRSSPLKEYYERRADDFRNHFALASKACSTAAVHEMRVDLKRLRTFFNLIEAMTPGFHAEEAFRPARKLFRAAGRVRNLQVLEAKVREASKSASLELSEYYNWLKGCEHREDKKFNRVCRRFDADFFGSAWLSMKPCLEGPGARSLRKGVEARFSNLIRDIREKESGQSHARRLHFLRRQTKEARYTLEALRESSWAGDDGTLLNDSLRDVHQPLGRWHDEEVLLESLREFRKRRAPGPLLSFRSYIEFSRLAKARKNEDLARFEAAWMALSEFLLNRAGERVLRPVSARQKEDDHPTKPGVPPENG